MTSENLIRVKLPEGFVPGGRSPCPIAAVYHGYVASVRALADQQKERMRLLQPNFDYYFDHLQQLPTTVVESAYPGLLKSIKSVEDSAAHFAEYRSKIPEFFCKAAVLKMRVIGRGQAGASTSFSVRWTEALEQFRDWRAREMDGMNVDMFPLLADRKDFSGKASGLFEKVFVAWAKEIDERMGVKDIRNAVLSGLPGLHISVRGIISSPIRGIALRCIHSVPGACTVPREALPYPRRGHQFDAQPAYLQGPSMNS